MYETASLNELKTGTRSIGKGAKIKLLRNWDKAKRTRTKLIEKHRQNNKNRGQDKEEIGTS